MEILASWLNPCVLVVFHRIHSLKLNPLDEWYKPRLAKAWFEEGYTERQMKRFKKNDENITIRGHGKSVREARAYELQLSRQLVDYFLEKYRAPYEEQQQKQELKK